MKKRPTSQRFQLDRMTIRTLDETRLRAVAGGDGFRASNSCDELCSSAYTTQCPTRQ